jgi:tetratricopeptide (TPR) repeat protein
LSDLISLVTDLLLLVALLCGLTLLCLAIASVAIGVYRVRRRGQVYVLPFRGSDERRGELMALFAQRLAELERSWIELALDIDDLRMDFANRAEAASKTGGETSPSESDVIDVAGGPRTTGEEVAQIFLATIGRRDYSDDREPVDIRGDDYSLADVDTGLVTVAGVSFSPQQVLAFLRRLPAAFATRRLHGTISKAGDDYLVTVVFDQRETHRKPGYTVSHVLRVTDDLWLKGLDDAAFHLERKRLAGLRAMSIQDSPGKLPEALTASRTVALAEVEADDWEACEAFLMGHRAQLRHYKTGTAVDRDEALGHYARALRIQPGYTRAAYNCATLLYNRYLPQANRAAIRNFQQATGSQDPRVAALAHAGLAMAYCQAINRFDEPKDILIPKAFRASQDALGLDPELEEALFAVAWTSQVKGAWDRALAQYEKVVALPANSPAGNRIKSFALNNAAWIWLTALKRRANALAKAEVNLQQALCLYPNKIAHANLAEVARRRERFDDALNRFECALDLDGEYVNARNERACLRIEMAAKAKAGRVRSQLLDDAELDHARAVQLADDDHYAAKLAAAFRAKILEHEAELGANAEPLLAQIPTR